MNALIDFIISKIKGTTISLPKEKYNENKNDNNFCSLLTSNKSCQLQEENRY